MEFKINNRKWHIVEANGELLLEEYKKEYGDATFCFGLTKYSNQIIYINKDMCDDVKKANIIPRINALLYMELCSKRFGNW